MSKLGMLMDPIATINIQKDSTFAMLLSAQARGYENYYIEPRNVWLQDGITWGRMQKVTVQEDLAHWFDLGEPIEQPLVDLDLLLMRKDPPFNMDYVYLTYLLELAEKQGLLVVNRPSSLRDANEKLNTAYFPQCCPRTLVSCDAELLREFVLDEERAIIKPLDSMGGASVFQIFADDPNLPVIIETLTHHGKRLVMMQRFIPEIQNGDKRILLVDGEPVPFALARVPKNDDFRGNLAAGAKGEVRELTDRDRWICEQVGPTLRDNGLIFVGLDVIGDYLTEINVTSPTCIRELDAACDLDIAGQLFDCLESRYLS